jgi:hypothetical protein
MLGIEWIVGIQLYSTHLNPEYPADNSKTPGIYAVAPSGLTLGTYKNSSSKQTFYVGNTWKFQTWNTHITLAAATGYYKRPLVPLLAISIPIGDSPLAPRLSFVPHKSAPLSLSIEWR